MTRANECYAYLTFVGEFDPCEITSVLGIQPTESWMKGSANENTKLERKASRWSLYSRLARFASLEDHLNDVLEQCLPVTVAITATRARTDGWVQLVGSFYRNYPGFSLEQEQMRQLVGLDLSLDFDFYYLYSDVREDS